MLNFALIGNPNCGKTTLFNSLTGSTAHVGNWPGVTVDKKEGIYKKCNEPINIVDLPGIYSLSPYTPEEVVSRNYILDDKPDCVINIIDATNLERNLYLTTQVMEIDVPIVIALNMMDEVEKEGDVIDYVKLEDKIGLPVVPISALKENGLDELMDRAYMAAQQKRKGITVLENTKLKHLIGDCKIALDGQGIDNSLFHAIKLVELDEIETKNHPSSVKMVEEFKKTFSDDIFGSDFEAIIADGRYKYISNNYISVLSKNNKSINETVSKSDKVDKVLTNKYAGIPIFLIILFFIFHLTFSEDFLYIGAMGGFDNEIYAYNSSGNVIYEYYDEYGNKLSNLADNDGNLVSLFDKNGNLYDAFYDENGHEVKLDLASDGTIEKLSVVPYAYDKLGNPIKFFYDKDGVKLEKIANENGEIVDLYDSEGAKYDNFYNADGYRVDLIVNADGFFEDTIFISGIDEFRTNVSWHTFFGYEDGIYSPGVILFNTLDTLMSFVSVCVSEALIGTPAWVEGLIVDGVLGGLFAILSFLPQILVLFLLFSILEDSGYMARVAFILDKIFRKFGLSGRAFMPMIMGFGCSIPAMANTKTLADEKERIATIRVIPFFSCGAKLPILTAIAGGIVQMFGVGNADVITYSMYVLGITTAIISVLLMRSLSLKGDISPFIMELPTYHMPRFKNLMLHLWDKVKHFIKKAFTIILASTIVIWFVSHFSWFWEFLPDDRINESILAGLGGFLQPLFTPLGFGSQLTSYGWVFIVATATGLIAKENVIATLGTLAACISTGFIANDSLEGVDSVMQIIAVTGATIPALIAFIAFNMTTIPCFAAVATAKAELPTKKSYKMTLLFWIVTSYIVSSMIYLIGTWWWTVFIIAAIWAVVITLIVMSNKGKLFNKTIKKELYDTY